MTTSELPLVLSTRRQAGGGKDLQEKEKECFCIAGQSIQSAGRWQQTHAVLLPMHSRES